MHAHNLSYTEYRKIKTKFKKINEELAAKTEQLLKGELIDIADTKNLSYLLSEVIELENERTDIGRTRDISEINLRDIRDIMEAFHMENPRK